MTREEQIKEASIDFQIATNPRCVAGAAFADFAREINVNQSFIEGAKWADNNPSQQALSKELHRLGYGITLNGDIISKSEVNKEMERYVEYKKNKLIEKACEWLEQNICEYEDIYYDVGGFVSPEFHIEEFMKDFKKAMEE